MQECKKKNKKYLISHTDTIASGIIYIITCITN